MNHITPQHMKEYVEANPTLVKLKPTSKEGIFVLKYAPKVFYNNLWTPELTECRGTVVDADYNVISRPFTKIYNRGERSMDIPRDVEVYAVEKINGFMGCATWHDNQVLYSTTGTIDSEFAELATYHLHDKYKLMKDFPHYSFIFEICDKNDEHIIVEDQGAYLLGARLKAWNSPNHAIGEAELDMLAKTYGLMRPKWSLGRFSDYVELVKKVDHEGYVCYSPNGEHELKMKSPYYLATKFLGRVNDEKFLRWMKHPEELRKIIDEEFYGIIQYIDCRGVQEFLELNEKIRMMVVRDYFDREVL